MSSGSCFGSFVVVYMILISVSWSAWVVRVASFLKVAASWRCGGGDVLMLVLCCIVCEKVSLSSSVARAAG